MIISKYGSKQNIWITLDLIIGKYIFIQQIKPYKDY